MRCNLQFPLIPKSILKFKNPKQWNTKRKQIRQPITEGSSSVLVAGTEIEQFLFDSRNWRQTPDACQMVWHTLQFTAPVYGACVVSLTQAIVAAASAGWQTDRQRERERQRELVLLPENMQRDWECEQQQLARVDTATHTHTHTHRRHWQSVKQSRAQCPLHYITRKLLSLILTPVGVGLKITSDIVSKQSGVTDWPVLWEDNIRRCWDIAAAYNDEITTTTYNTSNHQCTSITLNF